MNGKLYIKKFIRDDGETLSFDAEEIYLSENNTLLVRSDPATTAVEFTEEDGGEMIRQRGATYSQPVSGLIVPKSTEYWALCVRLSRFFILNHTYKIVYIKRDGSMFSMNRAWINAGLQIVPVPYENYSTWTIEFRIGDNFWTEYAENGQGKEIYSNSVELPLLTAGTGGEVWNDVTQQTLSGLGNYFTIDGTSISASINKLEVRGDTYQQTYSGKNLIYTNPKTNLGITASYDASTGVTTISGQATDTYAVFNINDLALPTGTYTLSIEQPAPVTIGVGIRIDGGTRTPFAVYSNNTSRTFTVPENMVGYDVYISGLTIGTDYNFSFKLQLETGSTATAFEPYVGGIPAPNPNYPQSVQVVTGEQTVNVNGKNLFDGILELGIINGSTGLDGVSNSYIRGKDYIPVKELTNYKFSTNNANITAVYVYEYRADKSYNLTTNKRIGLSSYLTTNANTAYIRFRPGYQTTDTSIKFQVEEGTVATAYEPYQSQSYPISLGSIELCKIGDYQDYIYKSGDDWYLHKEVGKTLVTGSSSEAWQTQTTNVGYMYRLTLSGVASNQATEIANLRSDYFTPITGGQMYSVTSGGYISQLATAGYIRFNIGDTTDKLSDFKTWLSTHNTTVYYALATPTDTKITDATLVGQLEALAGAQAYNGKTVYRTNSVAVPAILSVELLQSVGGGEIWDNVGAVWEEGVGGVQTINVETTQTTYPVWTVTGPCSNPTLQNDTTDTLASFDGMIASGQTLTVDFADNTAYLDSAPVAKYVSGYVSLAPGENVIGFNSDGGSTQTSTISWDNIIN